MRSDFPAIYENDKGEFRFVPDPASGPIGFFRSKMTVEEFERLMAPEDTGGEQAPEKEDPLAAAANAFKQEAKHDPVDETPEDEREEVEEPDPADALAGWAQR